MFFSRKVIYTRTITIRIRLYLSLLNNNMSDFTFPRKEHLKSRKQISLLFSHGISLKSYPLKFQYLITKESNLDLKEAQDNSDVLEPLLTSFVVSKRNFKKAVDRNRIKRQMIESFRLHKSELKKIIADNDLHVSLMIIYITSEKPEYRFLEKSMLKALNKLADEIDNSERN